MKISDLIQRLQAHPNQEAEINLFVNVINGEIEEFDEDAEMQIISEDSFYNDFVDIIVSPKIMKDEADRENSFHLFLDENQYNLDIIKVEIDINNGIYILDETNGVLRECKLSNPDSMSREEKLNDTILKLRKML